MIDLSRYDDAEQETWPNMAALPREAFKAVYVEPRLDRVVSYLKTSAPFLALGLLAGLLPLGIALSVDFLVDYWELGGTMYALSILGAAGVIGIAVGVLGTLCWRRLR
jgi:hypothetical protein